MGPRRLLFRLTGLLRRTGHRRPPALPVGKLLTAAGGPIDYSFDGAVIRTVARRHHTLTIAGDLGEGMQRVDATGYYAGLATDGFTSHLDLAQLPPEQRRRLIGIIDRWAYSGAPLYVAVANQLVVHDGDGGILLPRRR